METTETISDVYQKAPQGSQTACPCCGKRELKRITKPESFALPEGTGLVCNNCEWESELA